MAESTRQALVVPITLLPHDNSDFLSIVKIGVGYQVVVRTDEWKDKSKGCFIQPDSIVDVNRPEFSFLKDRGDVHDGKVRIRACKFRGVLSFGLLIPTDAEIGVDLAEQLGIEHYDPELDIKFNTGDHVGAPPGVWSKYDIESLRHKNVFVDGEPVVCTEKMEGAFGRVVCIDGITYVGSRTLWKKDSNNIYWNAVRKNSAIFDYCRKNEGYSVYGEVIGMVKDFKYGLNGTDFIAFDIRRPDSTFMNQASFFHTCNEWKIRHVPILALDIPYSWDKMEALAEGQSTFPGADHVREGVIVHPKVERWDANIGRAILKLVGFGYLSKKGKA